jgi:hypothetical protein
MAHYDCDVLSLCTAETNVLELDDTSLAHNLLNRGLAVPSRQKVQAITTMVCALLVEENHLHVSGPRVLVL